MIARFGVLVSQSISINDGQLTFSSGRPNHPNIPANMRYLTRHVLFYPNTKTRIQWQFPSNRPIHSDGQDPFDSRPSISHRGKFNLVVWLTVARWIETSVTLSHTGHEHRSHHPRYRDQQLHSCSFGRFDCRFRLCLFNGTRACDLGCAFGGDASGG